MMKGYGLLRSSRKHRTESLYQILTHRDDRQATACTTTEGQRVFEALVGEIEGRFRKDFILEYLEIVRGSSNDSSQHE